jgi:hypothetical protein
VHPNQPASQLSQTSSSKEETVLTLFGREYIIHGESIIDDAEANEIYSKLLAEKK